MENDKFEEWKRGNSIVEASEETREKNADQNVDVMRENCKEENEKKIGETLELLLYAIAGLALTVVSFLLYINFRYVWVAIPICVVDVIFAYFNLNVFLESKDWNGARILMSFFFMTVYWTVAFGLVCYFEISVREQAFYPQLAMYPFFLMPSFMLQVVLVGFLGHA